MTRSRKRDVRIPIESDQRTIVLADERIDLTNPEWTIPKPKSATFNAPPCTTCPALRKAHGVEHENYSFVYHTAGRTRYCKCRFCGTTFKVAE